MFKQRRCNFILQIKKNEKLKEQNRTKRKFKRKKRRNSNFEMDDVNNKHKKL